MYGGMMGISNKNLTDFHSLPAYLWQAHKFSRLTLFSLTDTDVPRHRVLYYIPDRICTPGILCIK